jgi:hypothetical protein
MVSGTIEGIMERQLGDKKHLHSWLYHGKLNVD